MCQALGTMRSPMRHLLRHRSFTLLLGSRLLGQSGDGFLQGALVSYSLFSPEKQATAAGIAAGFALLLLPYTVLGPFAGLLIDRVPRRRVIATGNLCRAVLAVALGLCVLTDQKYSVLLPVVLLALGVNRAVLTAHAASIACTVTTRERFTANSLAPTLGSGASAIATVLSPGLVHLLGDTRGATAVVVSSVGVVWAAASAVISRIGRDVLGPHADANDAGLGDTPRPRLAPWSVLADGVRTLNHARSAARAIAVIAVHRILFGFTLLLTIMHARATLASAPTGRLEALGSVALVGALAAVGTMAGTFIAPRVAMNFGAIRAGATGLVVAGVVIPGGWWFGMERAQLVMYLAAPVIGISYAIIRVSSDTIIQSVVADGRRGRVFSVYDILMNLSLVVGIAVAAVALPWRTGALLVAAIAVCLAAFTYSSSARKLTEEERAAIPGVS